ncbi:NIPSNAP family protein [Bradyrhizobium elkanii]|uniref:NIPSNAP family protein n=1 Tax=Bradyrhizobium elkanii TaxID=29448 RepID=UPI0005711C07|nr:NIPSNAP family protein [Bradyrhizobium elkanii]WLA83276.1 NIPSNAP family protein [Bradyrhizobium elkanii]
MFAEMRIYTIQPGQMEWYLDEMRKINPVLDEHLGPLVAYFTNEFGMLNQVVSIRTYSDLMERTTRRKTMFADPRFKEAGKRVTPVIQRQQNWFLQPTDFSPLR